MTEAEVKKIVMDILNGAKSTNSDSLKDEWQEAKDLGITDGSRPQGYATREQVAAMIVRATKE